MPGVYQWDGTRLAGRTNATGTSLGDYQHAYGWAISSREGLIRSTLHTDVHGTPQLITDNTGAIAGWTRTDVWGVEKASTGAQSRFGHTGYLKDPLLGDELYAQARQYRAGVGRFTTVDEWEGDVNNPVSLNPYLYGYGNPGTFVDPDGRVPLLRDGGPEIARWRAALKAKTDELPNNALGRAVGAGAGIGRGFLALSEGFIRTANYASNHVALGFTRSYDLAMGGDNASASIETELADSHDAAFGGFNHLTNEGGAADAYEKSRSRTVEVYEGNAGAIADASEVLTTLGAPFASRGVRLVEGESGETSATIASDVVGQERAALQRIGQSNADGSAANSSAGLRVTVEGKASGGRGLAANGTVDRIAAEYAGAVQQANRVLMTTRVPRTAWERIYRVFTAAGLKPPAYVRGNALQQIADRLMESNRYATEAGSIANRQSRVASLKPLRPDVQVPISPTTQGVIDITTPGQAPKIGKYNVPENKTLINVLYEDPP